MDVKYLNYILSIADHRNMTSAAEELFVSQSALSQYLSRLEQELGTPLFFRSKNELSLTPAGELYVQAAREVVRIQKELYRSIAGLAQKGHITVGVTSNFGLCILSEIIPQFHERYPGVSIEISEVNPPALKKMLAEETADLGIAADISTGSYSDPTSVLRREPILFAIPRTHPFAAEHSGHTLTIEELTEHFSHDSFLLARKGSSLRAATNRLFAARSFAPSAICETNSIPALRNLVARGAGVSFIAQSCCIDRRHIAYYQLEPELFRLNLVICRKNWNRQEPEQAFLDLITGYFDKHTEEPFFAEAEAP